MSEARHRRRRVLKVKEFSSAAPHSPRALVVKFPEISLSSFRRGSGTKARPPPSAVGEVPKKVSSRVPWPPDRTRAARHGCDRVRSRISATSPGVSPGVLLPLFSYDLLALSLSFSLPPLYTPRTARRVSSYFSFFFFFLFSEESRAARACDCIAKRHERRRNSGTGRNLFRARPPRPRESRALVRHFKAAPAASCK